MWCFELHRIEDESGVSGTGHVADGVEFEDGTCVLRWRTKFRSTAIYESITVAEAVHGHNRKTVLRWRDGDESVHRAFHRGISDCQQDRRENCPFASIGGPEARMALVAPEYIKTEGARYVDSYLRGYARAAENLYGADWRTCEFAWTPALTIGDVRT